MTKTKNIRKSRNKNRNKNTRKRKISKGGFLKDIGFGINGINFSKETGQKRYNWNTGKWDAMNCYDVGGFKWCKIVPNEDK